MIIGRLVKSGCLLTVMLLVGIGTAETNNNENLGRVPGGIRMYASFDKGEPSIDIGLGEKRLSRSWWLNLYSRHPRATPNAPRHARYQPTEPCT